MQAQDGTIMGPMPPRSEPKAERTAEHASGVAPVNSGLDLTSVAMGVVPALVVGAGIAAWVWMWVGRKVQSSAKLGAEAATLREMQDMVRTLLSELDRRTAMLEETIHAADQRLAMLEEAKRSPVVEVRREPVRRSKPADSERHPLSDRVVELSGRGATAIEIARELGCPTGQVELILALRRAEEG